MAQTCSEASSPYWMQAIFFLTLTEVLNFRGGFCCLGKSPKFFSSDPFSFWMQAIFFLILTGALYLKPPPADTQSNPLIAYSRPPSVPFLFVPQEKGLIRWVP